MALKTPGFYILRSYWLSNNYTVFVYTLIGTYNKIFYAGLLHSSSSKNHVLWFNYLRYYTWLFNMRCNTWLFNMRYRNKLQHKLLRLRLGYGICLELGLM